MGDESESGTFPLLPTSEALSVDEESAILLAIAEGETSSSSEETSR